jgi:hypothetical protein
LSSTWHARSAGSEEAGGGAGAAGTAVLHRGGAAAAISGAGKGKLQGGGAHGKRLSAGKILGVTAGSRGSASMLLAPMEGAAVQ